MKSTVLNEPDVIAAAANDLPGGRGSPRALADQPCPGCPNPTSTMLEISKIAHVNYYRCEKCGYVWTLPKDGNQNHRHDIVTPGRVR